MRNKKDMAQFMKEKLAKTKIQPTEAQGGNSSQTGLYIGSGTMGANSKNFNKKKATKAQDDFKSDSTAV